MSDCPSLPNKFENIVKSSSSLRPTPSNSCECSSEITYSTRTQPSDDIPLSSPQTSSEISLFGKEECEKQEEEEEPSLLKFLQKFEKEFPLPKISIKQKEHMIKERIQTYTRKPHSMNIKSLRLCLNREEIDALSEKEFMKAKELSHQMVDDILQKAILCVTDKPEDVDIHEKYRQSSEKVFKWPKISTFQPHKIPQLIKDYINCWNLRSLYKFTIIPLGRTILEFSTIYKAQIVFNAPTPNCPNPQATASIFFTFEISRVVPNHTPVYVTYQFEGRNQIHVADNRFNFQEGVIQLILCAKLKMYSELEF